MSSCVNSALDVRVTCDSSFEGFSHVVRQYSMLELVRPPDMRTLLEDPVYAAFTRRRPKLAPHLTHPSLSPAWQVWVLTTAEKWRKAEFSTYDECYALMRKQLALTTVSDVAIVCKRRMVAPPDGYVWSDHFPWCARCRRPSSFTIKYNHRALRGHEVTYDEPFRCFYCGIRQAATPRYSPA